MGMISQPAEQQKADVLEQVRQKFEAQVPEKQRDALNRVVTAGKKVMYSKESNSLMEEALAGDDPVTAAGENIPELMGLLIKESRNTMPKDVVVPAMVILLTDVLDYLKQTGRAAGDAKDLDTAAQAMSEALMQEAGVTPEIFQEIAGKAQETMKDPAMLQKMQGAQNGNA